MQTTPEENHLTDCRIVHARLAEIASARGALDAREPSSCSRPTRSGLRALHRRRRLAAHHL